MGVQRLFGRESGVQNPEESGPTPIEIHGCCTTTYFFVWIWIGNRWERKSASRWSSTVADRFILKLHATDILRIIAMSFHETIWKKHAGWLKTATAKILSAEIVKSVIQKEYYHSYRVLKDTTIYQKVCQRAKSNRKIYYLWQYNAVKP
ncbi:MAG: hypothetical protein KJP07_16600 [Desulfatitalea sp.]|nr:hypothetical protein [Desulfatitalea sp.]